MDEYLINDYHDIYRGVLTFLLKKIFYLRKKPSGIN